MDQGVALFPENELVAMKIEFCGSAAMVGFCFWRGRAPRNEMSERIWNGNIAAVFLGFFFPPCGEGDDWM